MVKTPHKQFLLQVITTIIMHKTPFLLQTPLIILMLQHYHLPTPWHTQSIIINYTSTYQSFKFNLNNQNKK